MALKIGCERILKEKVSAGKERPVLKDLLDHLDAEDSLVVWKLDRLGIDSKGTKTQSSFRACSIRNTFAKKSILARPKIISVLFRQPLIRYFY
jgi:DNA invertase Pin-like site-specific DNA recombinase